MYRVETTVSTTVPSGPSGLRKPTRWGELDDVRHGGYFSCLFADVFVPPPAEGVGHLLVDAAVRCVVLGDP
jgi:hypothetical protein